MALLPITHKPTQATARQFDGSLDSFLDILSGRPLVDVVATVAFDDAGSFASLTLMGGAILSTVTLGLGDWIIFPADTAAPAYRLDQAHATDLWQPS